VVSQPSVPGTVIPMMPTPTPKCGTVRWPPGKVASLRLRTHARPPGEAGHEDCPTCVARSLKPLQRPPNGKAALSLCSTASLTREASLIAAVHVSALHRRRPRVPVGPVGTCDPLGNPGARRRYSFPRYPQRTIATYGCGLTRLMVEFSETDFGMQP
jgi:hypothetical protein